MSPTDDDMKAADWFAQAHAAEMDPVAERSWLKWIEDTVHQQSYENCELAWEFSAELRDSPRRLIW